MRRLLLVLVAGIAAVSAVVVALSLRSSPLQATVGPDTPINPPRPIDANNSPTIVQNPRRPENLVVTHRVDRPRFTALLHSSLDGGRTWQTSGLPLPDGLDRPFAPDAAFAPDGTLFVSYVNLQGQGNVPDNVWLSASRDGGRTLDAPVRVAGSLAFQVRLAVGGRGVVHLTWLQAKEVGLLKLTSRPNPVVSVTSTDEGRSFFPPVTVSDPARERVGAASPVVDKDGNLLVLYQDFKGNRRDFEFLEGPPWDEPSALVVTRSADGGRTFEPSVEIDNSVLPGRRFLVFLPEFPSLAVGSHGNVYVAWADATNGDEDVFLARSHDGGRTWGSRQRVNANPAGDGTSQYLPRVGVSPGGRIDVVYLDRGADPEDVRNHTSLATSADGGRSFTTVRLSSRASDSQVGPQTTPQLPVDLGSRLALLSGDDRAVALWTDTRQGSRDTGRQDIYAAAVGIVEQPQSAVRGSAVTGLAFISLLTFGAWAVASSRRRRHRIGARIVQSLWTPYSKAALDRSLRAAVWSICRRPHRRRYCRGADQRIPDPASPSPRGIHVCSGSPWSTWLTNSTPCIVE